MNVYEDKTIKVEHHNANEGTLDELVKHYEKKSGEYKLRKDHHENLFRQIHEAPHNTWEKIYFIVEIVKEGVTEVYTHSDLIFKKSKKEIEEIIDSVYC